MNFYYSIANIIPDLRNHHQFLVNHPEVLEKIYDLFNEIERGTGSKPTNIFQVNVINTAEDEFYIEEGHRNLSNEQIYKVIASTEPSEYNSTGFRVDIISARLLSIFEKREAENIISIPLTLVNPLTGRSWSNYFAVRFTSRKKRMMIISEAVFVDDKTHTVWFNDSIMKDITALNLPDIAFTKMLPKKFP